MKEEIRQPEHSNEFWFLNLEGQLELVENAPFRNVNNFNVILDNKHLDYSCTLKEVKKEEVEVKVELYKHSNGVSLSNHLSRLGLLR